MGRKDIIRFTLKSWGVRGYRDLPDKPGVSERQYQFTYGIAQTLTIAHIPKIIIWMQYSEEEGQSMPRL